MISHEAYDFMRVMRQYSTLHSMYIVQYTNIGYCTILYKIQDGSQVDLENWLRSIIWTALLIYTKISPKCFKYWWLWPTWPKRTHFVQIQDGRQLDLDIWLCCIFWTALLIYTKISPKFWNNGGFDQLDLKEHILYKFKMAANLT